MNTVSTPAEHRDEDLREVNEQLIYRLVRAQVQAEEAFELKQLAALASDVQRSLLPPPCHIPGLETYSMLIPKYEVGGDFFDILRSPRQRWATFLIGDVIGKGAPAALIMVMALTLMREIARTTSSPARILKAANRRLCASLSNSSIYNVLSAAVLTIDIKTRTARYARAGHEELLLYRAADKSIELFMPAGVLLGLGSSEDYQDVTISLLPGDLLVLFTDGLTEARNARGSFFGIDRLQDLIGRRTEPDLQAFGDHVLAEVRQFEASRQFRDDVILLMIEVTA